MTDLLVVGNHSRKTGYARVLNALSDHLALKLNVVQFDIDGDTSYFTKNRIVHGNASQTDYFGIASLEEAIITYRPAALLVCHDPWFVKELLPLFRKHKLLSKLLYYCPVDREDIIDEQLSTLISIPHLIFYTSYTFNLYLQKCGAQGICLSNQRLSTLPHGVDSSVFYPLQTPKQQLRQDLFPENPKTWDTFLVYNCNRNIYRKRLDNTLLAFAAFRKKCNRPAMLIMLCESFGGSFDISALTDSLGITEDVVFIEKDNTNGAFEDIYINKMYNAVDVCLNTAENEGWGLIPFESACAGTVPLIQYSHMQREIWDDFPLVLGGTEKDCAVYNAEEWAVVLERLCTDTGYYVKNRNIANSHARSNRFEWHNIALEWLEIISKLKN